MKNEKIWKEGGMGNVSRGRKFSALKARQMWKTVHQWTENAVRRGQQRGLALSSEDGIEAAKLLLGGYATFIAAYWRLLEGFPHYVLSDTEKLEELRSLLQYDHSGLITGGVVGQTMHALGIAWSYFPHAWDVVSGNKRTPREVFDDDSLLQKALLKRLKHSTIDWANHRLFTPNEVRKGLRSFSGTQGVSNFRPTAAAAIYHKLLPAEGGTTWDMSSGWGGRLLGAVACHKVKKYIACDPASETFAGLKAMEADIRLLLPERKLETDLHMLGSETKEMRDALPKGGADLCFTSPPYFDCEKYSEEKTQSWVKFRRENQKATREAWLTEFMGETLNNCEYALKPGGILAINIADVAGYPDLSRRFVEFAESHGWRLVETMKLSLSRMMGAKHKGPKFEPIFVFKRKSE